MRKAKVVEPTPANMTHVGVPMTIEIQPNPRLVTRLERLGAETRWGMVEAGSMHLGQLGLAV